MLTKLSADIDLSGSESREPGSSLSEFALRRLRPIGLYFVGEACDDTVWHGAIRSTYLTPIDQAEREAQRNERSLVSFAAYDYLGLSNDMRVKDAACEAVRQLGVGCGASRLVGGERSIHATLESDIASFLGVEDALALVSGFLTNLSLIGHLLGRKDLIVVDEFSHNSVMLGGQLSPAQLLRFRHNDYDDLERILTERRRKVGNVLIVVEGLYSMDGDIPDLPRLLEIKKRHDAWLMVDEAHSFGVLGRTGRGVAEHFGVNPREIDILMGTLSKALTTCGGFIAGSRQLVEWLRFSLPAFVFSVGLSPAIAAGTREALSIIAAEPWRVERLRRNSRFFIEAARARKLETGPANGAGVVCIYFEDRARCIAAAKAALAAGFYAPPIAQTAVPKGKPRIRFFISSAHTDEQMIGALDALVRT